MQRARYAKVIMKASDAGLQGIFRTHSIIYAVLSLQRFPKHNAPQTSCLFRWTQPPVNIREIRYQNLSPQLPSIIRHSLHRKYVDIASADLAHVVSCQFLQENILPPSCVHFGPLAGHAFGASIWGHARRCLSSPVDAHTVRSLRGRKRRSGLQTRLSSAHQGEIGRWREATHRSKPPRGSAGVRSLATTTASPHCSMGCPGRMELDDALLL